MQYHQPPQFMLCLYNEPNRVSLELGKLYRVVEPEPDDPESQVRLIDESGEDYLFPRQWFVPIELPQKAVDVLTARGQAA